MKLVRAIYLGLALSMGTIFSHHVAGGEFVNFPQFLVVAIASYGIGALLSNSEMEGPGLAAAIVVTQLLGHFALSANYDNSLMMYSSHIFFGLLGYLMLSYIENLARWAFDALIVRFEKFPEFSINHPQIIFLAYKRICFLNKAITRFWSPAPPLPSL